ncbi:MAG TPA: MFS transporter [Verrucomicrobiae bacterium]|nr:MFS transporter [Verrucomicrobiae bacterium]
MTRLQRYILSISILASFVAFLDGSVVNVALPAIKHTLGGGLTGQQWIVDSYLTTLGAIILVAGSMSDLYGRKRVLLAGLVSFGVTSLLCASSPTITTLVIARALQGVAGALLVPSSLALITSNFEGGAKAKAIGTWTGWTGLAFIIGPLLGGSLVQYVNWRFIFVINVIPIVATLCLLRTVPTNDHHTKDVRIDVIGALLGALGLGLTVFGLIEQGHYGILSPVVYLPFVVGILTLIGFLIHERTAEAPMLPLNIFTNRNFSTGNIATAAIYAALSVNTFTVIIFLQQVAKYTAFEAGLALIPVTLIMFFMSPRFGKLSGSRGPRLFMTFGPLIAALGFLGLLRVGVKAPYITDMLPVFLIFAVGLSMTVSPLTGAVLSALPSAESGIASAVNNAVARIAGLIGIAAISLVTGSGLDVNGLHKTAMAMSILLAVGGIVSFIGIRNTPLVPEVK